MSDSIPDWVAFTLERLAALEEPYRTNAEQLLQRQLALNGRPLQESLTLALGQMSVGQRKRFMRSTSALLGQATRAFGRVQSLQGGRK
jgi:hypothetical protein